MDKLPKFAAAVLVLVAGILTVAQRTAEPPPSTHLSVTAAPALTKESTWLKRDLPPVTTRSYVRGPVPGAAKRSHPTSTHASATRSGPGVAPRIASSQSRSLLADVTEYCATGNRNAAGRWPQIGDIAVLDRSIPFGTLVHVEGMGTYRVEDWVGYGTDFDIYAGGGGDCETRANNFGRHHLRVTIYR